jgi:hypothetical protein
MGCRAEIRTQLALRHADALLSEKPAAPVAKNCVDIGIFYCSFLLSLHSPPSVLYRLFLLRTSISNV